MKVYQLLEQFTKYQMTNKNPITLEECLFLLENEGHEAFYLDSSVYSDIMDYRDHLELEME